ncbi:Non-specific lipid-transfer protein 5, partial [Linum perenne]
NQPTKRPTNRTTQPYINHPTPNSKPHSNTRSRNTILQTQSSQLSKAHLPTQTTKMAAAMKLVSLFLVCALIAAPMTVNAMTCGQVAGGLAPCLNYLKGSGLPTPGCCNGIKGLVSAARTTADRRQACNCLKSSAANVPGLNPTLAAGLPGKCGVNIPYKISTSTNCNTVQ